MNLRSRLAATVVAVGAAVGVLLTVAVPGSLGAYTARITNSANTVSTNPWFTCLGAAQGDTASIVYEMDDTQSVAVPVVSTTMADQSGNLRNGQYTTSGVAFRQTNGPCARDGGFAVTLNGSTGYSYGPNTTYNPSTFSEEIWFKTTTGGGKLMGFGNARTGSSSQYDRHVYLTNAGNVVFGVYPGAIKTVQSTATYLDGRWHHVVATQAGATNANPGIRLYVDGALVGSDSTVVTNENAAEYWRIGYDNINSWGVTQPTNFFFTGSLAFASLYLTTALTPTQVRAHFNAGL